MDRAPIPGTAAERAQRRRDMVRANVREHRRRKGKEALAGAKNGPPQQTAVEGPVLTERPLQQIRLCQILEDTRYQWVLQTPLQLHLGTLYRDAFISALRGSCEMPDHQNAGSQNCVPINVCCGTWVNSACIQSFESSRGGTNMLSDALLTTALAFVGNTTHNPAMLRAAVQMENYLLSSIRQILQGPEAQASASELQRLTTIVLTLAVADLLVKKSWKSLGIHLTGISGLIKASGPQGLDSEAAINQFYAIRAVQLPFAFIERRRSLFLQQEWLNFPSRDQEEAPYLQSLVDVLYRIPSLMEDCDTALDCGSLGLELSTLLKHCREVEAQIKCWQTKSGWSLPWFDSTIIEPFNIAEFDVTGTMQFQETFSANISSLLLGALVGLSELILAILCWLREHGAPGAEINAEVDNAVDTTRLWSARALRCVNTFRKLEPRTTGKLVCLFPLDMAWKTYQTLRLRHNVGCDKEIEHCEGLSRDFEATGLPSLRYHS